MFEIYFGIILVIALILVKLASRRNQTTKFGAPWVPLEPQVVNNVMELAQIKPGEVFYDLGSGDGCLVIAAAFRGARAYGVEVDRFRVWYSRFCIFIFGLRGKAKIIHANIFNVDLTSADVITTYLLQETNNKLFHKFNKELKPGTRIVSAAFNYPAWEPVAIDPRGPIYGPLHLYHFQQSSLHGTISP